MYYYQRKNSELKENSSTEIMSLIKSCSLFGDFLFVSDIFSENLKSARLLDLLLFNKVKES